MNGWSSFANDKKIADKWRQFLTEAPIAGINSDVYPDSLTNMLQPMVDQGIITIEEKEELISLMLQLTTDDDIVLEALGGPSRDPRSFSDASTRALNDLIGSLGLKPDMRKRLDGVFDQWARLNTVKFSQTDPGIGLDTIELPPPAIPEPGVKMPLPPPDIGPPIDEPGVKMPLPPIIGPPIDDEEEEEEEITTTTTTGGEDDEEITNITTTGTGDDEEEEEEDTDEKAKEKMLSIIGATLDGISAAGVFPPAEATLVPTGATLASLGLNLYQKKMGWALLDLIALVPWAGKFAKAGSLGKLAKTVAATGKTGKVLAATTKAMKLADPAFKATKIAKGIAGVKELYEHVPEEYIRTAVYTKTDDGKKYYIDFVLEVLGHIPHPIIKAGVEALKEAVVWIRKDLGEPEPERQKTTGPSDVPEPGMDPSELTETYNRWQTIAGINKRVL
tara:strand:+ start:142 stop:1482 length:1341 start_codon:yes stop_codon:yes gene_type:complete